MNANLMLFAGSFASYLVCFFVFVAAIVIACFIGIAIRKSKNANEVTASDAESVDAVNNSANNA